MVHNTRPPASPAQPKQMESYFFSYTYANPPAINGVTTKQSYIGSGFAPVGTYKLGQTITVFDKATGRQKVGTYQIGNVNNQITFDANKINHINVFEYDYFNQQYIQGTGLQNNNAIGAKGLGSEGGILLGQFFNNQSPAIRPMHF